MRKLLLSLAVATASTLALAGTAMAGNYGMAGCGLGALLWSDAGLGGKIDNVKVEQVLAATTNGTFGSQTFGITTGISECTPDGTAANEKVEAEMYADSNLNDIARDAAAGGGEYLATFATAMGCSGEQHARLQAYTHENFERIFTPGVQRGTDLIESVRAGAASDTALIEGCTVL